MRVLRDVPLRRKLATITALATCSALLLMGGVSLVSDSRDLREEFDERQRTLARVTSAQIAASLAIQDVHRAQELLRALVAESGIRGAVLRDARGRLVAEWIRPGLKGTPAARRSGELGLEDVGDAAVLRQAVNLGGRRLGTLALEGSKAGLRDKLFRDAVQLLGFLLLAGTAAAWFALRLQRSVTEPILALSEASRRVGKGSTWSVEPSLPRAARDEVGTLVRSFQDMLLELRRREDALRKSEAKFRMLTEQASDGIVLLDSRGRIESLNPAACALLGLAETGAVGLLLADLIHPDDLQSHPSDREALGAGKPWLAEHRYHRGDGSWVWVESNTKRLDDGHTQAILRDLTSRRHLEEQLRQSQKMEAVGQLAGGIAHDFNNLLTVITGFSESLALDPKAASVRSEVREIQHAAEQAAALTRRLLAFGRRQVQNPERLDLRVCVGALDRMLRRIIGDAVTLETRLPERLGWVRADAGQMEQILLNLVVNARDAMPEGGHIFISLGNLDVRAEEAPALEVPPGRYVLLTVEDTGGGIKDELLPHIFEPFFTTKPPGSGTGLGLSTVYGIVHQSGGHLRVEGRPGLGARFLAYFPRLSESSPSSPA